MSIHEVQGQIDCFREPVHFDFICQDMEEEIMTTLEVGETATTTAMITSEEWDKTSPRIILWVMCNAVNVLMNSQKNVQFLYFNNTFLEKGC